MNPKYTSLTLNGNTYSSADLLSDSEVILKSLSIPGWKKKIHLFIQDWLSPSSHLDVLTSGSTGFPKLIRISKENMIKSALRTGEFLQLKEGDNALLCLPVDYIAGKMMVVRSFVLGLDLMTVYPSSNPLLDFEGTCDFTAMTPMQVHHILEEEKGAEKLNGTGVLIIGGGELDPLLSQKASSLACRVYQTYGMTETLSHVAMKKISGKEPETCYQALPGVRFELDERGCLVITDEVLGIHNMTTNDQAELVSGSGFRFLGRIDNVINSGGLKIVPEHIENKLSGHTDKRIVIAGMKDRVLGEKLILIMELRNSEKPPDLRSLLKNAALTKHEKPREIFFVDFFPESSSGKVLRKKLLERIGKMKGQAISDRE